MYTYFFIYYCIINFFFNFLFNEGDKIFMYSFHCWHFQTIFSNYENLIELKKYWHFTILFNHILMKVNLFFFLILNKKIQCNFHNCIEIEINYNFFCQNELFHFFFHFFFWVKRIAIYNQARAVWVKSSTFSNLNASQTIKSN